MRCLLYISVHLSAMVFLAPVSAQQRSMEKTQPLPQYTILRTNHPVQVDGDLREPAWQAAANVGDFIFPWWAAGDKERTEARLLWDDDYLYVAFVAYDKHISAVLKNRDDPVSKDDAVEVFFAPDKDSVSVYFNFEFNALGTILDRSPREKRSKDWNAQRLQVAVAIDGTLNNPADEDRLWVTEIAIPFADLAPYTPGTPKTGDIWRLNLYRIGGQVNPQYSVWSDTFTDQPRYHTPERFGVVTFSATPVDTTAVRQKAWGIIPEKPIKE